DVIKQRFGLQELVAKDVDLRHHRRVGRGGGLLAVCEAPPAGEQAQGQRQRGAANAQAHDDSAPLRPSCRYQSAPSLTPTSIGNPLWIWPGMHASESSSLMWRWIARRSGRAP